MKKKVAKKREIKIFCKKVKKKKTNLCDRQPRQPVHLPPEPRTEESLRQRLRESHGRDERQRGVLSSSSPTFAASAAASASAPAAAWVEEERQAGGKLPAARAPGGEAVRQVEAPPRRHQVFFLIIIFVREFEGERGPVGRERRRCGREKQRRVFASCRSQRHSDRRWRRCSCCC